MVSLSINSPFIYRTLLEIFQDIRSMQPDLAHSLVRNRLKELQVKLVNWDNIPMLVIYESYVNYYSKRFADPAMRSELSILDPRNCEAVLAVDPSRYDQLFGLALYHFYYGQRCDARYLLKKIASSCFREAKTAQRLLASFVEESVK